jgi:hypothetical protein
MSALAAIACRRRFGDVGLFDMSPPIVWGAVVRRLVATTVASGPEFALKVGVFFRRSSAMGGAAAGQFLDSGRFAGTRGGCGG